MRPRRCCEGGFQAVKLRLGYATLAEDLAVTRAVRARLPDAVQLMVDYNQALSRVDALQRGRALQDEGVAWLEEPIRHDDLAGNAQVARELALPLQLGENFDGPKDLLRALQANACDLVMPDVARIGGVTGWIQAAGVAEAHGIPMSSHLMPEVSAHLLAATPTCHWLEYVDWTDAIAQVPATIIDGHWQIPERPGTGWHGMRRKWRATGWRNPAVLALTQRPQRVETLLSLRETHAANVAARMYVFVCRRAGIAYAFDLALTHFFSENSDAYANFGHLTGF